MSLVPLPGSYGRVDYAKVLRHRTECRSNPFLPHLFKFQALVPCLEKQASSKKRKKVFIHLFHLPHFITVTSFGDIYYWLYRPLCILTDPVDLYFKSIDLFHHPVKSTEISLLKKVYSSDGFRAFGYKRKRVLNRIQNKGK